MKGVENEVADTLSRIETVKNSVDHRTLAAAQQCDNELHQILNFDSRTLRLEKIRFPETEIYCDIATGTLRPFVLKSLRYNIFQSLHGLFHPEIHATQNLATTRFVWPSINKDCRTWTRQCIPCRRNKVTRHVSSPVGRFKTLAGRFEHIYIDIIAILARMPILSNVYRLFFATARSHSHGRHGSANRRLDSPFKLDFPFRRAPENNNRPGTPI